MKLLRPLLCLLLGLALACAEKSRSPLGNTEEPPLRTVAELTPAELQLVEATNQFGFSLFRRLVESAPTDDNVFLSPLSASYALAMAYNGAGSTTREAMARTLAIDGIDPGDINLAYQQLSRILINADSAVTFDLANALFHRQGLSMKPSYLMTLRSYFKARVKGLDFRLDESVDSINAWVKEATNGQIQEIATPPLPSNTMLLLANAMFFAGAWTLPFDTAQTFTVTFRTEAGQSVPCRMMTRNTEADWQIFPGSREQLLWYGNDTVSLAVLPYGSGKFRAAVVCPQAGISSRDLCRLLTPDRWNTWIHAAHEQRFELGLPKFRLDVDAALKDPLAALGMDEAFSDAADFSQMADPASGLFISDVRQKCHIQVDELGTTAAVVTDLWFADSIAPLVWGDHPFLFIIYEETSGTILLMGRVGRPEWN
jgi:serine protease inhibitor